MIWQGIAAGCAAYLLGSIPFGYLLYRFQEGGDVRTIGSGNIGATNVLRGAGALAGTATLLLDGAKGYLAVAVAAQLTVGAPQWTSLAALMAIIGHIFPVFLKFRGGKGVATCLGAFMGLALLPVLLALSIFAAVAGWWRYVSLASIVTVAAFPFLLLAWGASPFVYAAAVGGAVLIISRHGSNIQRLLAGKEQHMTKSQPRL